MKKLGFIFAFAALFTMGLSAQNGTTGQPKQSPKPKPVTAGKPAQQASAPKPATPKNTVPAKTGGKTKLVRVGTPAKMSKPIENNGATRATNPR